MSRPIPLLLLGAGFSRGAHVPALRGLSGAFRIAGVFSRTRAKAEAVAGELPGPVEVFTELDRALEMPGIEAVDVALPILPASDAIAAALGRGLHVFSEKPIAESVERARALLTLQAPRPDQVWYVAENFRFWETAWRVRELIASGEIGTPLLCHYPTLVPIKSTPWFQTQWRREPGYAGGFLLDGGVHDIAALRLMLGEVSHVSAFVRGVDPALPPADTLAASLQFESGLVANYSVSYALEPVRLTPWSVVKALLSGAERPVRDRFGRKHIVGTHGSIFFMHDRVELVRGLKRTVFKVRSADMMVRQFEDFHAGVRAGQPIRNSPREALHDLAVIEALLTSARERTVTRPARLEDAASLSALAGGQS
ncbi:Gfo/Idh/MocA family protein [Corallococcus exiguus]|uniref:Gfo/Idh/MocA family oxidoreductase n=1 Tax=Corallococcus exiguus TaxID=83462 RepID=A0A7X4Y8Z9_9BACT|nr:Gfo/Idh/MocA family oxidoreductase [Corallococcus exiguus]NBC40012.1 Gfo/Idh/MocA family oxidoreductase [Corallococcus exiguus]TNV60578.1 Gfo/Idh/MocA family oxidoreductase [Corallococcus exiguus]